MSGGLWDYSDPAPDDWSNHGSQPDQALSQGFSIEEDEEGNGRRSKRCKKAAPPRKGRIVPPKASANVIVLDEDDEDSSDSDLDDDFKIIGTLASKASTKTDSKAPCTFPLDSSMPAHDGAGPAPAMAAESYMSKEVREALEQSKKLARQLADDDDNDDCIENDPTGPSLPSMGSLRMPQHFRMPHHVPTRASEGITTAEEEEDARLVREYAAAAAAGGGPSMASGQSAPDKGDKMTLCLQCKKGSAMLKLWPTDPFSKLQAMFLVVAAQKGWIAAGGEAPTGLKMMFDGEKIDLADTPASLDMEDEEKIDVSWKA